MSFTTTRLGRTLSAVALGSVASLILSACGGSGSDDDAETKLVYFMAPNTTPTRYIQQDGPSFEEAIQALDDTVEVRFVNAGGDSATQLSQANAAIAAGADALVIVAADPNTSASILEAAEQATVPVIGYENPPLGGPMYAQVIFDPEAVGAQQATYFVSRIEAGDFGETPVKVARLYGNKGDVYTTEMLRGQDSVLQELIDDGRIDVVCEDYVKDWDPNNAQTAADQCLTRTQNDVDAFLGFYDGITAGIIAALKSKNVQIPVHGGQNPELTGLQYMLTGDQQDNVLKAFSVQAEAAAQIALAAINGEDPPSDLVQDTVENDGIEIPTAKLESTLIHLEEGVDPGDAVQQAVDLGIFTWEEICTGPAENTPTCQEKVG